MVFFFRQTAKRRRNSMYNHVAAVLTPFCDVLSKHDFCYSLKLTNGITKGIWYIETVCVVSCMSLCISVYILFFYRCKPMCGELRCFKSKKATWQQRKHTVNWRRFFILLAKLPLYASLMCISPYVKYFRNSSWSTPKVLEYWCKTYWFHVIQYIYIRSQH